MKKTLDALIRLTEAKKSLLVHMREDCATQYGNITSGNLDGIEYLINRREEYMRRIEKMDAEFSAYVEQYKAKAGVSEFPTRDSRCPEEWDRLEALTEEIRELYSIILKEDRINTLAMKNMMADNRSELKQVKEGQRLNQAYYPPYGESSRIDDNF